MTECESRSAGSKKGWKCQLVRGHPGPYQNDAGDSLDEWKDPEPPPPSDNTEQVRKLREALEWALVRCESGMLYCWFCPQQLPDRPQHDENCPYAQARTALAESEAGKTEQVPQVKQSPDPMGAGGTFRGGGVAPQLPTPAEIAREIVDPFEHANTVIKKYMDDLSPSSCGVEGHRKVDWTDWTERRLRERRIVAHICTPYSGDCVKFHPGRVGNQRTWRSDKPGNSRIHVNRRVTNSGGYCVRCMEIKRAVTDALECRRQDLHCERWKVMPKQFIDKGTAAILGKEEKWRQ